MRVVMGVQIDSALAVEKRQRVKVERRVGG